jgi:hypothetical protein
MKQEDIIRMAREAGLHRNQHNLMSNPVKYRFSYDGYEENFERFAALVAAAEREACAKVCESAREAIWEYHDEPLKAAACNACTNIADAIRARGNT